jgi:hypothetical protein
VALLSRIGVFEAVDHVDALNGLLLHAVHFNRLRYTRLGVPIPIGSFINRLLNLASRVYCERIARKAERGASSAASCLRKSLPRDIAVSKRGAGPERRRALKLPGAPVGEQVYSERVCLMQVVH